MNLVYPLEMYYPDFNLGVPKIEDQFFVVNEYKNYINHCIEKDLVIDKSRVEVLSMEYLLNKLKQESYFQGVRDILNYLFMKEKTPNELFISLFPDREELVEIFKQQFIDACELLIHHKKIDLQRMRLSWSKFNEETESEEIYLDIKNTLANL